MLKAGALRRKNVGDDNNTMLYGRLIGYVIPDYIGIDRDNGLGVDLHTVFVENNTSLHFSNQEI